MDLYFIFLVIILSIFSLVIHEFAHSLAAYFLGDDTAKLLGRMTLNPIKHIDPFMTILLPVVLAMSGGPIFGGAKPVPINYNKLKFNEFGFAIVAISGPLANLLMAFLLFGISTITNSGINWLSQILILASYINLGFFIFNMMPIPPLDGSRLIYPFAPEFIQRIMQKFEIYGIALIFIILIVFGNYFSLFISNVMQFIINMFGYIFRV